MHVQLTLCIQELHITEFNQPGIENIQEKNCQKAKPESTAHDLHSIYIVLGNISNLKKI